jgi:hypothetical protein
VTSVMQVAHVSLEIRRLFSQVNKLNPLSGETKREGKGREETSVSSN